MRALSADRREVLRRLFFAPTAPLVTEGEGWLLDEQRGRYDPLLRYLARNPDSSRADIAAHIGQTAGHTSQQVGVWLAALEDRFRLLRRVLPAFASPRARRSRYRIVDNFLVAWLGALAGPVAFVGIREVEGLLDEADDQLAKLEGVALERLTAALYEERSRRGVGDFALSEPVAGWWDLQGAEVDLVAIDRTTQRVRLGSCKRSGDRLVKDLPRFEDHVGALLAQHPELAGWTVERVAIAPTLSADQRDASTRAGYTPQDLPDLLEGLIR